jgi:hypothetical protein
MTLDEKSLTDALGAIDAVASPDLAARARAGGRRRLVRRRSLTAVGAVALGAAAAPVTLAVRSGIGSHGGTITLGASPTATDPGLYAAPPLPGSRCNEGYAGKAAPATYPDLLLLPPSTADMHYAFVRNETSGCASPHVALTAIQRDGDSVGAGLVVQGPNAPTPVEDGRQGPSIEFSGITGHEPIDGQPGTEYTIPESGRTDGFWTEPDGGQWHAVARGMSASDAVALFNRLEVDGHAGTASVPESAIQGWTVEPPADDVDTGQTGMVISQWIDAEGHLVDMTVSQTPDRTFQHAVESGGQESIVTVRGRPAVLAPTGGNGGNAYALTWQESKDAEVELAVTGGTASEIKQVAESLVLASADDPRISGD